MQKFVLMSNVIEICEQAMQIWYWVEKFMSMSYAHEQCKWAKLMNHENKLCEFTMRKCLPCKKYFIHTKSILPYKNEFHMKSGFLSKRSSMRKAFYTNGFSI